MNIEFFRALRRLTAAAAFMIGAAAAQAEPQHGIAMYGDPALPPDFVAMPYVNAGAPRGGKIVSAEVGTFDSLNPYIQKGSAPWQLRYLIGESLMGRSLDEPFTLYGLLASGIETGPNREWVEFTLNPAARFSDGSPVTAEDVMWSFEILGTQGHGRYRGFWEKVSAMTEVRPGVIRFEFNVEDRELALLAALRPVLKKAQWDGIDFAESGLDVVPITSAPYVIDSFEAGRYVSLRRNPDYWGNDIPFRVGTNNLDEVRMEFFADETAAFEAFKVGEVNTNREFNVAKWDSQYNFPAVQSGDVVLSVLPHERPSGMTGFVMNSRKPQFADWRVRDAMIAAFNFEFINDAMTGGQQPRITSYWSNSPLGMTTGPATDLVKDLLDPFAADLTPGTLEGYTLPVGDGTERNRPGTTAALAQMEAAGWIIHDGRMVSQADGAPFTFDILLQTGSSENAAIVDMYVKALERLGITPTVTYVDDAQYKERTDQYDFDMTYYRVGVSLSPGNEQYSYFGSEGADVPGGRNLMGVKSPAVDALIGELLTSASQTDFVAAVQALDRVMTAGRYVIPIYQWNISRIAHARQLHYPEVIPIFGDWPGWQPDVWWWEE